MPEAGDYLKVSGDREFCVSSWGLGPEIVREFVLTDGALYLRWQHNGKDSTRCIGLVGDVIEARAWVDEVNSRYRSAS
ncbi:MAG: hypothetical protein IIA87_04625 [Nanoarchaeota archaeon]|nr:hypothetical protein [Nanoarchaeota archaeon]